jgi:hypothetical protein
MKETKPTARKMIAVHPDNWKLYNKVAKHMSKEIGFRIPVDGALNAMYREYIQKHPEVIK